MNNKNIIFLSLICVSFFVKVLWNKYYKKNAINKLTILAWHNSINLDIVKKFEENCGVKINVKLYTTNEELISQLRFSKENIDLIFPSDYIFPELLRLKLIREIKVNKIKKFHDIEKNHFLPVYYNKKYYGVPNEWGVIGLAINSAVKEIVGNDSRKIYDCFFNGMYKNKTFRIIQITDMLMISNLVYHYYKNIFLKNKDRICIKNNLPTIIFEILQKQKKQVISYTEESLVDLFKNDVIDIALMEADRYLYMKANNPELNLEFILLPYYILKISEFFAIPCSSKNENLVYEFINFCLEEEQLKLKKKNNYSFSPLAKPLDCLSHDEKELLRFISKNSKALCFSDHILSKKDLIGIQMKIKTG
jgi:spermidine/putrescine-binding protein